MAVRTDYDSFADAYDRDRKGGAHEPNWFLRQCLAQGLQDPAVLDIGCGPGHWLGGQMALLAGRNIRWVGLDPSAQMLKAAQRNASGAELVKGIAEAMPFPDASFDLAVSHTSFHHFEDKEKALDEVRRVLRAGGVFELGNIDPKRMPNWWVYAYFPETRKIDEKRFWSWERLVEALAGRGFSVEHSSDKWATEVDPEKILKDAEGRTLSQLAVLDDGSYARGLKCLRELARKDPGYRRTEEVVWSFLTARKGS